MRRAQPSNHDFCSGFTLVELLVIITTIAVLAAIAFAVLFNVNRQGDATKSMHNIEVLVTANMAYAADNGRYAPADDKQNLRRWHGARKSATQAFDPSQGFLGPYLGKSRCINVCPAFQKMAKSKESFEQGTGGYGYNAAYIGGLPGGKWNSDGTRLSAMPSNVLRPGRTVMFTSTAYARSDGVQEYPFCEPPFWDFGTGPTGDRPSPTVHFRFSGKALVAWCDGHTTFESMVERAPGTNPHGGDVTGKDLGWFGPDQDNGYWNPQCRDLP